MFTFSNHKVFEERRGIEKLFGDNMNVTELSWRIHIVCVYEQDTN